jgi:hypothetical protein
MVIIDIDINIDIDMEGASALKRKQSWRKSREYINTTGVSFTKKSFH